MLWFLVAMVSGVVQGSFTLPMKYTGRWKWENTWGMWSVWALLIMPWLVAFLTVPHLLDVYRAVPVETLVLTFGVSLAWGVGAITFGMGVDYVGIALGFAIIMGLSVALGSLIPLFLQPDKALRPTGLLIIAGMCVMMLGIAVGAKAGVLKDKALGLASKGSKPDGDRPMITGIIICIIAGVCGALINIAFVIGAPIMQKAKDMGVDPTYASNAVWCISLSGGFLVNFGYCLYVMLRRGTWRCFRAERSGVNWLHSAAMGCMWFGSLAAYGICSAKLGDLGPAMGFAVFIGVAMITGNLWGVITGEWKGTGRKPLQQMMVGLVVQLAGIGMIAWSKML